jgi:hypothetical protein
LRTATPGPTRMTFVTGPSLNTAVIAIFLNSVTPLPEH